MDQEVLILLIALSVAFLAWGATQLVLSLLNSDRYKLQQRLAGEWRAASGTAQTRPVILELQSSGLPPGMARMQFFQNLHRKLIQANPDARITSFLLISSLMGFIALMIGWSVTDSVLLGLMCCTGAAYLPMVLVNSRRNRRQRTLNDQLPEALDFLMRVLRAGHSLSTGLQLMGEELPKPISAEFRKCYDQHSLGQPLENCLKEMAGRIDSADFAFFVTAVLIQRQTGGDLSEVLGNIATMIRKRIRLQQHVKAITAEGRLTGYILVAFPAVLFLISFFINPQYAGLLVNTDIGRMMLGGAVVLQMIGLFVIKKIVTVKV